MKTYFVSYVFAGGFGNGTATTKRPIRNADDVLAIEQHVENDKDIIGVKVLFFQDISPPDPAPTPIPPHQEKMITDHWIQYEQRVSPIK